MELEEIMEMNIWLIAWRLI